MRLTQKQRGFTLDIIKEVPPGQAYMVHYKVKTMAVADACASRLLKNARIRDYLKELQLKMESDAIANPIERRKILSEIARASIPDYIEEGGIKIDKQSPNTRAIAEIETRSRMGKQGAVSITKFKLHSPTPAIDLLNKMDRIYEAEGGGLIDNRVINIYVNSEEAKKLTEAILSGKGTE